MRGESLGTIRAMLAPALLLALAACGDTAAESVVMPPQPPPVRPATLEVGEGVQIEGAGNSATVTARVLDQRGQAMAAVISWRSTDTLVATVDAAGAVLAVRGGHAHVIASLAHLTDSVHVAVHVSTGAPKSVRVVYAVPSDVEVRQDYREAVRYALVNLQSWYRNELGGYTFDLYSSLPEVCQMPDDHAHFAEGTDAWNKVREGVKACGHETGWWNPEGQEPDHVYVIYADVEVSCESRRLGNRLGAAQNGLAILPREDLEGLVNPGQYEACDGTFHRTLGGWIGGAGHELAHAFWLSHPSGCDATPRTCSDHDYLSLMSIGYLNYPDTYLIEQDQDVLLGHEGFVK